MLIQAARRMMVMMPKEEAGMGKWTYPTSTAILEKAGLYNIEEYIQIRRQTITSFTVNRPIFDLCREGERRRGSSNRQFDGCNLSTLKKHWLLRQLVA